ncbi:MAG: TolC family protein, partial [Bacteroidota bacterium]|nr:TolC family protein [Bacteroidota bacterium]
MKLKVCIICLLLSGATWMSGQVTAPQKPSLWDLKTCLDYARKNNIQVQKARITIQESAIDLKQSKEALLPSVSAGSNLNLSSGKVQNVDGSYLNNTSVTSGYSINADMTLFDGLSSYKTIKQNQLRSQLSELSAKETENSIVVAITEAYLELLYAHENLEMAQRTAETAKAQVSLSENRLKAGSIANADFSQVKAQYSSDLYNIVTAQNALDSKKLTLKQLLELDMTDEFDISLPEIKDEDVIKPLPSKQDVYQTALNVMPEIKSGNLSIDVAQLSLEKAKSSYLPNLSLSAGIQTGHYGSSSSSYINQLNNNLGQSLGLSLSIPIYNRG